MFDHVTIRASDRARSEHLYRCALAALDVEPSRSDDCSSLGTTLRSSRPTRSIRRRATCTWASSHPAARRSTPSGMRGWRPERAATASRASIPVHVELLRRLPTGPGRQQHRGGHSRRRQTRGKHRPPVDWRRRSRERQPVLSDHRPTHGAAPGAELEWGATVSGCLGDLLAGRRRAPAYREPSPRFPGA